MTLIRRSSQWLSSARIRTKLALLGLGIALVSVLPMIAIATYSLDSFDSIAHRQNDQIIKDNLHQLTTNIVDLIAKQDHGIQQIIDNDLNVAQYALESQGGLHVCDGTVPWNATNQVTREATAVTLPKLCIGDTWLGQNSALNVETPLVDQVKTMVGSRATIFQRMNDAGDLLRIATNVPKSDTERAIGSFIPAHNADGAENAVVATVMRGETYRGIAFVWDGWYVTAYQPLKDAGGNVFAVLFVGVKPNDFAALDETLKAMQVGKSGYVFVLGATGTYRGQYLVSHEGKRDGENIWDTQDANGQSVIQDMINKAVSLPSGETAAFHYLWQDTGESAPRWKTTEVAYYQPWDWVIGVSSYDDDYAQLSVALVESRSRLTTITVLIGLGIAVVATLAAWLVARGIANPLTRTAAIAKALSQGDLSQRVALTSRDETGILAQAFDAMAENLQHLLETERESRAYLEHAVTSYVGFAERVAKGDLTTHSDIGSADEERETTDDLTRLGMNLNQMVGSLRKMAGQIRDIASGVTAVASEIRHAATEQLASSSEQEAAVTETTAAVEELRATALQATERSEAVKQLAQHSVEVSHAGQAAVAHSLEGMQIIQSQVNSIADTIQTLSNWTEQIGEIITTVNEIAEQSKLLALNASIEAARAGDEGKGFAVVAMEVRQLAEQSRQSTQRVRDILLQIQKTTENAVVVTQEGSKSAANGIELVTQAGDAIQELAAVIDQANRAVAQIAASTQQQRIGIEQLTLAIRTANEASVHAAQSAQQTERSVKDLNAMASELQNAIARYRLN